MQTEKQEQSARIPIIYTNAVQFSVSVYDFSLLVGLQEPPIEENGEKVAFVTPKARIIMSPSHFKMFIKLAQQFMDGYEKEYGTVAGPESKEPSK